MIGRDGGGVPLEGAPESLVERVSSFLADSRSQLRTARIQAASGGTRLCPCSALGCVAACYRGEQELLCCVADAEDATIEAPQAFQRKPMAQDVIAGCGGVPPWLPSAFDSVACQTLPMQPIQLPHLRGAESSEGRLCQDLIVVASLVDKVPNLAGLCRTCEVRGVCFCCVCLLDPDSSLINSRVRAQVFRAAALVVADMKVLKEHSFTAVSMTAELWVPVLEVPETSLLAWLLERQRAGYRLVGLEQACHAGLSLAAEAASAQSSPAIAQSLWC